MWLLLLAQAVQQPQESIHPSTIWGAISTAGSVFMAWMYFKSKQDAATEKREAEKQKLEAETKAEKKARALESQQVATNEIYAQWQAIAKLAHEKEKMFSQMYQQKCVELMDKEVLIRTLQGKLSQYERTAKP